MVGRIEEVQGEGSQVGQVGVWWQEKEKKRSNSRQSLDWRSIGQWFSKSVPSISSSWELARNTNLLTESEILVVGPRNLCVNKIPREFWCFLMFERLCHRPNWWTGSERLRGDSWVQIRGRYIISKPVIFLWYSPPHPQPLAPAMYFLSLWIWLF